VYANRDSLTYQQAYGLQDVETLFRGTIRHEGYCRAWDALITLGLTDPVFQLDHTVPLTCAGLVEAFLGPSGGSGSLRERSAALLGEAPDSMVMDQLAWLGLFSNRTINPSLTTPAQILEDLLLERWPLQPADRDMVIMQHVFQYQIEGKAQQLRSTLVVKGADHTQTAMSTLVGLPLGVFVKQFLLQQIRLEGGVHIPTSPGVYRPVMDELAGYGVVFTEEYT
jgi:saccharopine dehydrogenase-like NADP-dependent oxidoreductase